MRLFVLAGALAVLCCNNVESVSRSTGRAGGGAPPATPGFVVSGGAATTAAASRKRPRGARRGDSWTKTAAGMARSPTAPAAALAGSFTAPRSAGSASGWFAGGRAGRRRDTQGTRGAGAGGGGQGHPRMLFGLQFQPPEFSVFLHGTVQAIMLGAFAAIIPKVTAERIREKEAGLALDEAYEAGLLDDPLDDEFGYAGGYVCVACDNTNEVECTQCGGKGFFVSASAMPKKCGYCSGLGKFPCEECEERRERLRRERAARMPLRELPPARGEDFPFGR